MSAELSVISPCYNEALNLPELVERLERVFEKCQIQGSTCGIYPTLRDSTSRADVETI